MHNSGRTANQVELGTLAAGSQRLVTLMQDINFGAIEALHVRRGEPVWDPPPRVVREMKFGATNGPRPEVRLKDFTVKHEVVELIERLKKVGDGVIDRIEIRHGLPFRMITVDDAAA